MRREVGVGDRDALGELEVVVEAVLDRRADRDLHARVELHHRGREHVGGVVADERQCLVALLRDDRDLRPVGQLAAEVADLPGLAGVADGDRQGGAREARADRRRGVGAGRAVLELEGRAVGQVHGDRHGAGRLPSRRTGPGGAGRLDARSDGCDARGEPGGRRGVPLPRRRPPREGRPAGPARHGAGAARAPARPGAHPAATRAAEQERPRRAPPPPRAPRPPAPGPA